MAMIENVGAYAGSETASRDAGLFRQIAALFGARRADTAEKNTAPRKKLAGPDPRDAHYLRDIDMEIGL